MEKNVDGVTLYAARPQVVLVIALFKFVLVDLLRLVGKVFVGAMTQVIQRIRASTNRVKNVLVIGIQCIVTKTVKLASQ